MTPSHPDVTMRLFATLAVCFVGWSILACGGGANLEDDYNHDERTQDMSVDDSCSPACSSGMVCASGMCVPEDQADMDQTSQQGALIGGACVQSEDCADDVCLADESIPGGYCSKVCGTGLPGADDRCPSGALCIQVDEGASICLAECVQDAGCRTGYVCEQVGLQRRACLPACTSDFECDYDQACDAGRCVEATGPGRVGSDCTLDGDCEGNLCFDEETFDWPAGTCSATCAGLDDGSFCDGAHPGSGLCIDFGDDNLLCLPSCTTSTDCREDYVCSVDEGNVNESGYGFCLPACEYLPCHDTDICDVSGICIPSSQGAPQITTQSLGTFSVTNESFEALIVEVPDGAVSFSLTLGSDNPVAGVPAILSVQGPNGETIFDAFNPIGSSMKHFDAAGSPAAFIYPNAPSLNLTPGSYIVVIGAYAPANVDVTLHIKRGTPPAQEELPLTLWFMDNSFFTASEAQSDPVFQEALQRMVGIYDAVGIDLSEVTYRDVSEEYAFEYAAFDADATSIEVAINRSLEGDTSPGAHVFFNDQLFLGDGNVLYGISAGLPGPPALNNTQTLGVFVALDAHIGQSGDLDPIELAATMGHELGHYLGLYHISEADGSSHDPLDDTAECNGSFDADRSGDLSGSECGRAAATNMMFWTSAPGFNQDQISPAQQWVLQRNPAIFAK